MKRISRPMFYLSSFAACAIMAVTSGCASGGFKLTRQYARFVNKQNIVLRVVLYILTGIVFAATLLIDMVVNNTMDFWEGRVSQGNYQFKDGDKTYLVRHEILSGSQLKRSTIEIFNAENERLQKLILRETSDGEIELYIDGKLRTRVSNISSLPMASIYDTNGSFVRDYIIKSEDLNTPVVRIAAAQ